MRTSVLPRNSHFRVAWVLVALVLSLAGTADAQVSPTVAEANAQFAKGVALLKANQYDEASKAFEQSQKLNPGWGTLINLARSYRLSGRLASAWAAYRDVALHDTKLDRSNAADKQAKELEKRLCKLRLTPTGSPPVGLVVTLDRVDVTKLLDTDHPVDPGAHHIHASAPMYKDFDSTMTVSEEGKTVAVALALAPADKPVEVEKRIAKLRLRTIGSPVGLVVTLDGVDVTMLLDTDQPVDSGRHQIHASAPSYKDFDATTEVRDDGKTVEVAIELAPADKPVAEPLPGTSTRPRSPRRTYGVVVAAGGGALVATGLVFGWLASSKWSDAENECPRHICTSADSLNNGIVSEARTRASISTALVIGGAVAIGVGVVLFVTAPGRDARAVSTALRLTPSASADAVSLTLDGRF